MWVGLVGWFGWEVRAFGLINEKLFVEVRVGQLSILGWASWVVIGLRHSWLEVTCVIPACGPNNSNYAFLSSMSPTF